MDCNFEVSFQRELLKLFQKRDLVIKNKLYLSGSNIHIFLSQFYFEFNCQQMLLSSNHPVPQCSAKAAILQHF